MDGQPPAASSSAAIPDDDLLPQAIRNRDVLRRLTDAHRWTRACGELAGWSARLNSENDALTHLETILDEVEVNLDKADARLDVVAALEKNRFLSLGMTNGKGFSLEQTQFWEAHRGVFFKALSAHKAELHRLNDVMCAQEAKLESQQRLDEEEERDLSV